MSTNIIEQLKAHAQELAEVTGGQFTIQMWAWVTLSQNGEFFPHCNAVIAIADRELYRGIGATPSLAMTSAINDWKANGGIVDPNEPARRELALQAEKLGMRLVPQDAPILTPELSGKIAEAAPYGAEAK